MKVCILGEAFGGHTWFAMCRTAPRCRDPDAVAAFGVQGEKRGISCKKWKESNKTAKQQGQ